MDPADWLGRHHEMKKPISSNLAQNIRLYVFLGRVEIVILFHVKKSNKQKKQARQI
jgi:hypothetical protein